MLLVVKEGTDYLSVPSFKLSICVETFFINGSNTYSLLVGKIFKRGETVLITVSVCLLDFKNLYKIIRQ